MSALGLAARAADAPEVPDRTAEYPVLPQPAAFHTNDNPLGANDGYWLDNDRILVDVSVRPEDSIWPHYVLIEWNTRTGETTDRGEGRILCVSEDSHVILSLNTYSPESRKNRKPYLVGPLGGPYDNIPAGTRPGESGPTPYFYNPFSCRPYPNPGQRKYRVPSIITPLYEGDGWVIEAVNGSISSDDREIIYVRSSGQEAFREPFSGAERSFSTTGDRYGIRRLPWLNRYLIPNSSVFRLPKQAYLLDTDKGALEILPWPESFKRFGVRLLPVQTGMVSLAYFLARGPQDRTALTSSGIYLLKKDGTVVKIHHWEADYYARMKQRNQFLVVSPNGCRIFVNAGVIDICKGDE